MKHTFKIKGVDVPLDTPVIELIHDTVPCQNIEILRLKNQVAERDEKIKNAIKSLSMIDCMIHDLKRGLTE